MRNYAGSRRPAPFFGRQFRTSGISRAVDPCGIVHAAATSRSCQNIACNSKRLAAFEVPSRADTPEKAPPELRHQPCAIVPGKPTNAFQPAQFPELPGKSRTDFPALAQR